MGVEIARDGSGFYAFVEKPLEAAATSHQPLWDAWQALGDVRELSGGVRARVQTVLGATAPGPSQTAVLPLSPWPEPTEARPRPTAAHPRAYQGTTYKPPQPKSAPSVNLRPYLCDPRGQGWLLTALGKTGSEEWALPGPFRIGLWPFLRERCPSDVPAFLALYWALRLDERPTLLAAVAKLVSLRADANALRWLQWVTEQPAPWQELSVFLLIESKAYTLEAERTLEKNQERFAQARDGNCPAHRLFWLLRGLATGLEPEYLMAGFRMSDRDKGNDSFANITQAGYFPEKAISDLTAHLEPADDYYEGLAHTVWRSCGELPGLGEVIEAIDWASLSPETAHRYLRLFLDCGWYEPDEIEAKWAFVRGQIGRIEEQLHTVPSAYQGKWVTGLKDLLWFWDDPTALADNLPRVFALLRRLSAPPFQTDCDTADVTSDYLGNLNGTLRERFLAAPDASFRHLEQACRRQNSARLVGKGTWSLTRLLPNFAVDGFLESPGDNSPVLKHGASTLTS